MEKIRSGGQITGEKLTAVRSRCPHGVGEATEVNGVKENVGVLWQQGVHLGEEG
jgi:hypothetical protein